MSESYVAGILTRLFKESKIGIILQSLREKKIFNHEYSKDIPMLTQGLTPCGVISI
jgi:hypothetical protein